MDPTLRRVVIGLRLLGWAWMMLLVAVVVVQDSAERMEIVAAAVVLATGWTAFSLWVAQSHTRMRSPWFVVADGVVVLLIGAASSAAGSDALFHGGYLISWLGFTAYAGGLAWTLIAAAALTVEQVIVHEVDDRGMVGTYGSVVFVVFALVLGGAVDAVRAAMNRALAAEHELSEVKEEAARQAERERLARRLHDSVLQTLLVIRRDAGDADHVRYLARRQERELRRTIGEYRSPYGESFISALATVRDEIEDVHRIEISAVLRGDAPMGPDLNAVVQATREALTNAAKHSGANTVDLYAAAGADAVEVTVRDRGKGFEVQQRNRQGGLAHSIRERIEAAGGTVNVYSTVGQGTEIVIEMERA